MKKIVSVFVLILVLCQLFVLCSCGCEHNWIEISNTATCLENGVKTFKCSLCEKIKTESSYATGRHIYEFSGYEDATKYEWGYEIYKCKKCGFVERRSRIIPYMDMAKLGLQKVIEKLKNNLIDPSSLQYEVECYKDKTTITTSFIYKIHYNAKNRFGGYVGYKNIYYKYDYYGAIEGSINEKNEYYYLNNRDDYYFTESNTN